MGFLVQVPRSLLQQSVVTVGKTSLVKPYSLVLLRNNVLDQLLLPHKNITRNGRKIFHGYNMMKTTKVHFVRFIECQRHWVKLHKEVVVYRLQGHSELEKGNSKDEGTCKQWNPCETPWSWAISKKRRNSNTSITTHWRSWENRNRNAIKSFLHCTHFLCKQHIPHTTNFNELINLIVSCGGKYLEEFVQRAARNVSYTSSDAVTDFLEAIGVWVDELRINQLLGAPFFSLLTDECTDIATIEELSIFVVG